MRLKFFLVLSVALVSVTVAFPLASAHSGANEFYNTGAAHGYAYSRVCANEDALLPQSKTCPGQAYNVPANAVHLHLKWVFPHGGSATLEANLQERTPVVGDFVTYFDRVCTTGPSPFLQESSVQCVGGHIRDWHAGTTHKFIGSGNEPYCIPSLCRWAVAVLWY